MDITRWCVLSAYQSHQLLYENAQAMRRQRLSLTDAPVLGTRRVLLFCFLPTNEHVQLNESSYVTRKHRKSVLSIGLNHEMAGLFQLQKKGRTFYTK